MGADLGSGRGFATLRWTRDDAAGPVADRGGPPAGRGVGAQGAYHGSGAVLRRNDGSLVLTGADKTPAFVREPLATGQSLELVRGAKGSRYWTTWDDHTLTFTRYAEQRPPDFLWKTPGNLGGPLSKTLARSPLGSKLGAIDFAHDGMVFGDSRFQVFTWVEHDPAAGGAAVSRGVRVVTPDGSFSDFAGDGVFARGAIKLDHGNTVEIGRTCCG